MANQTPRPSVVDKSITPKITLAGSKKPVVVVVPPLSGK
jgi:hypothetical protein